jgi:general secretion pathway protein I
MSKPQRGISLPLLIAAGVVAALAAALLLEALMSSLALSRRASQRQHAEVWARAMLAREAASGELHTGISHGRFDSRYRWRLKVSRWPTADDVPGRGPGKLLRLDLTVHWHGSGARAVHVYTFRRSAGSIGAATGAGDSR